MEAVGYKQSPMHSRMELKKRLEIRRSVKINVEIVSGPARRDVYVKENKSTIFPTRWVKNVTVAERAINTWFSVLKVVK